MQSVVPLLHEFETSQFLSRCRVGLVPGFVVSNDTRYGIAAL